MSDSAADPSFETNPLAPSDHLRQRQLISRISGGIQTAAALLAVNMVVACFNAALPTVHKPGFPVAGDTLQWWSGVNPEWPKERSKQLLTPIAKRAE